MNNLNNTITKITSFQKCIKSGSSWTLPKQKDIALTHLTNKYTKPMWTQCVPHTCGPWHTRPIGLIRLGSPAHSAGDLIRYVPIRFCGSQPQSWLGDWLPQKTYRKQKEMYCSSPDPCTGRTQTAGRMCGATQSRGGRDCVAWEDSLANAKELWFPCAGLC